MSHVLKNSHFLIFLCPHKLDANVKFTRRLYLSPWPKIGKIENTLCTQTFKVKANSLSNSENGFFLPHEPKLTKLKELCVYQEESNFFQIPPKGWDIAIFSYYIVQIIKMLLSDLENGSISANVQKITKLISLCLLKLLKQAETEVVPSSN